LLAQADPALVHPCVETGEGPQGSVEGNLDPEVAHPSEAGDDVERDELVAGAAREPWPAAVGELHFRELPQRAIKLLLEAVALEQQGDLAARLGLASRLAEPWSLLDGDGLQLGILLQRALERGRSAP